jgi:hypothetical protein
MHKCAHSQNNRVVGHIIVSNGVRTEYQLHVSANKNCPFMLFTPLRTFLVVPLGTLDLRSSKSVFNVQGRA